MKALIYTWLILGLAFLAYDYLGAPRSQRLVFERKLDLIPPPKANQNRSPEKGPHPVAMDSNNPATTTDSFVPPAVESLETLTKNWTVIPQSAFPRSVKLSKPTDFKMSAGTSRVAPGSVVTALSCENGSGSSPDFKCTRFCARG